MEDKILISNLDNSRKSPDCSFSSDNFDDSFIERQQQQCCSSSDQITSDELPIFAIRSISPSGRSLSPIDNDLILDSSNYCFDSPIRINGRVAATTSDLLKNNDNEDNESVAIEGGLELMSLADINAQITPPVDENKGTPLLETIYEDIFLDTPPNARKLLIHSRRIDRKRKLIVSQEVEQLVNTRQVDEQNNKENSKYEPEMFKNIPKDLKKPTKLFISHQPQELSLKMKNS